MNYNMRYYVRQCYILISLPPRKKREKEEEREKYTNSLTVIHSVLDNMILKTYNTYSFCLG